MRSSSRTETAFGFCAPAVALLTAASVVFLAWSSSLCLHGLDRSSPPIQRFTIAVSTSAGLRGNAVLITRLIADGKGLRGGSVSMDGRWISYWDRALSHPETPEPASISFEARRAVVMLDRLGKCGHLSISGSGGAVWEDNCSARANRIVLDLPSRTPVSGYTLALRLAVFIALASIVRPWSRPRRAALWLMSFLAIVHLLFWSTQPVGLLHDSLKQIPTFEAALSGKPGYFPPGYPILVGIAHLLGPASAGSTVTIIQHAMMITSIWWCYRMLERSAGTTISLATALATGAAAPTLILPQGLLSENVALFGMAGALYFAARFRRNAYLRDGAASGLMLGWAALARIVPLAGGVPAVLAILIYGEPARAIAMRKSLVITGIVLMTIAAPALWFGAISGDFALSSATGLHLYNRVVADQGLLDPNGAADSRLLRLLGLVSPTGVPHWEVEAALERKGVDKARAEALMRQAALEGIRRSPWKYIAYSFRQAWKQYFLNPDTFMPYAANPFDYPEELEPPPLIGASAESLLWRQHLEDAFAVAWRFVPWIALASVPLIPLLEEHEIILGLALISAGYLLTTAFVEYLLSRYNAAIVPFVVMLAGAALAGLIRAASAGRALMPDRIE